MNRWPCAVHAGAPSAGLVGCASTGMPRWHAKPKWHLWSRRARRLHVEPMNNMPVIKDLVTDMAGFWEKIRQVQPWLQPTGPAPEGEYLAAPEAMNHLTGVMHCIMCGACVSDCAALEVNPDFVGPAALAKAYRFVADPRDGEQFVTVEGTQ